eukprot:3438455-Amphidinium_carterae.1
MPLGRRPTRRSRLSDCEAFDLVMGTSAGEGLEAWWRIHSCWGPSRTCAQDPHTRSGQISGTA